MTKRASIPQAEGFSRTLQTAMDAEGVATLIDRATERAKKAYAWGDAERLQSLAQRYRDYAAALRQVATIEATPPELDQASLL